MRATVRLFGSIAAIAGALIVAAPESAAQKNAERFTAFAVDMGVPGRGSAGVIEIVVERYSTSAETDRLMKTMLESGPEKLLSTLQDMRRVGFFRAPGSLGWDIKYARKVPGEDGGETISLLTDRFISFLEARNRPRTIDYPFTLIELRMPPEGEGEGKLSLATKIIPDKRRNTVILEDYKSQPVMLKTVKRESGGLP